MRRERKPIGSPGPGPVCDYCDQIGHEEDECPALADDVGDYGDATGDYGQYD